jgi:glycerol-3-phosphate acyltransferase PlsY
MPWLIPILGYFLGSIPSAYIAGRLLNGVDIRQVGNGNVGAANAFRQLGAKVGIAVFAIDAAKGGLATIVAQAVGVSQLWVLLAGAAAVVGHNWPLFLGFRGGRGEATTIGVLLALIPQPVLLLSGPVIITLIVSKNVPVTSCVLFIPLSLVG